MLVRLAAVLLFAGGSLANIVAVKCGDPISLRSKTNYNYLTIPATGQVGAFGSIVGPNNVVYLECRDKPAEAELETGDCVALKSFRAATYVRDLGKDGQALSIGTSKSYFWVENPSDLDARTWVFSTASAVSLRSVLSGNGFVAVSSIDNLARPEALNSGGDSAQFLISVVVPEFKDRCPHDKNGDSCSGRGTCENNFCSCDDAYAGEFCEHLRGVSSCQIVGLGHVRTFDSAFYDFTSGGEFLIYGEPNSQSFEALTGFFTPVPGGEKASGLSAITLRRGEDYITVRSNGAVSVNCGSLDMAGVIGNAGPSGFTTATGLNIVQGTDGWWTINSPSRVRVVFKGSDIFVSAQEPLIGSARGLCGDNNNDPTDDLMPRTKNNEPDPSVTEKLRIEDGNSYLDSQDRQPVSNGRASRSFATCNGDNTFFNFISAGGEAISYKGGKHGKGHKEPKEPKKQPALTMLSTRSRVREKAGITGAAGELLIENAILQGICKDKPDVGRLALKCCAGVLQSAQLMTNDGDLLPGTSDAIKSLITQTALDAAWKPKIAPKASNVAFEAIACSADYCARGTCRVEEYKANVLRDQINTEYLTQVAAEVARTTKLQLESKKK